MGLEEVQARVEATDAVWQWVVLLVGGAIPFVESYGATAVGVVVGVPFAIALVAAVAGNVLSMVLVVTAGDAVRRRLRSRREPRPPSPRTEKLRRRFDRFGVPGVSLLGQTVLPSQITSGALVAFGADRRQVVLWQVVSIVLWGLAFGGLATAGLYAVEG
ncbi:hypothetical protein [uncultured Pseudokineococcus sp.]|uniref:hypothetical protein n=1 Tax=uncultured Pseudokineococcus sp. TaxID=1642928 RepID=UPI002609E31C|nr:hypothetical protein [uncultured Pseudokineococcus sp.]